MILSDGLFINGSELTKGVCHSIDTSEVTVTGGLAGDGGVFDETLVGLNGPPQSRQVAALGFYGHNIQINTGSEGGWDEFGPKRLITRSEGNVLYEVDGKPALPLYKMYLGEEAKGLPGTALCFPLAIWNEDQGKDSWVIRTIQSINETEQSMQFSGDVPQGWNTRLMWGKFDKIIDASVEAARVAEAAPDTPSLSIMISCLGRKILLGQRIIQEVYLASKILGEKNQRIGFYSYGEIAPQRVSKIPMLHNQTMIITTLFEKN